MIFMWFSMTQNTGSWAPENPVSQPHENEILKSLGPQKIAVINSDSIYS